MTFFPGGVGERGQAITPSVFSRDGRGFSYDLPAVSFLPAEG